MTGLSDRIEGKDHRIYHFGASVNNHRALHAARRKWLHDATLPSRLADASGFGGMQDVFRSNGEALTDDSESQSQWWIDSEGRNQLGSRQSLETLDKIAAMEYMPETQETEASFIMGPYNSPTILKLRPGRSVPLRDAWKTDTGDPELPRTASKYRNGFIINLGANVHCLDWAPTPARQDQYLATSCLPPPGTSPADSDEAPTAPAFSPQPPYKSNLRIWRFCTGANEYIDIDTSPRLDLVFCTEWGDAKALKWSPSPYRSNTPPAANYVGLLGSIWADGSLRILDVASPEDKTQTHYIRANKAALESRPPDTVCTCLTWISSTRIAAGCANGCIAVWDLPIALQSASSNPRPTIYSNIASTYILSIANCYPSHPHLLLTGSMGGSVSLTDLSRSGQSLTSQANTAVGSRARMGLPLLAWHDFAQIAIQAEDNTTVKGSTLRRFFAGIALARARSNPTSIATSPCHPCVLVGCADGEVFATNPMSRVVDTGRSETWQQIWFAHEWKRPRAEELEKNQSDSEVGISRFTEGFKAESISLGDGRSGQKHNRHQGTAFTTVYEQQSAITALAWNPNSSVGGWAAAGMGNGLLRVEDVSI